MHDSLHICNARIWTGTLQRPWASALTIRGGLIHSHDQLDDASDLPRLDARGRTAIPGLIDAHMHLLEGGLSLQQLDLSTVTSRREFEARIGQRHRDLPPSQWLIARGWSSENWLDHALPDKSWLTAIGDRPTVCWRMDHHAALVNDAVLQHCNLADEPAGGTIVRKNGSPTGLMLEAAAWSMIVPLIPEPSIAQRQAAVLAAQKHCHQFGLTTVGSMEYWKTFREIFLPLRDQLTLRCRLTILDRPLAQEPIDYGFLLGLTDELCHPSLSVRGCKTFIDGTLGSRTARMLADYADDPGNRGMLLELASHGRLSEWLSSAPGSPSMHAIGDEAVRVALDAIERARSQGPPRIEHAQHIDPADFPRFKGVITSMQPLHKADDGTYVDRRLGRERLAGAFAFRSLLDHGAKLAFGSDWPIVSCDPLLGIRAAVTGLLKDGRLFLPEQNITVEEALCAYTAGAGRAIDVSSTLMPGEQADLVILDRDPFTADWAKQPPKVDLTIRRGRVVYDPHHELEALASG